jgi:hypothetical protein
MKSRRLLSLAVVFLVPSAFANPDPAIPFRPRFEAMRENCLKRDYPKLSHEIVSPKTKFWDYSMSPAEDVGGRALMKTFQESSAWARAIVRRRNGISQDEKDLAEMMAAIGNFAAAEKLGKWERACLSKCVTAHMITYDDTPEANFLVQPARIAERGIGVCKQFAMLGEYISDALGVKTDTMSDEDVKTQAGANASFSGHAYNKITIDGVSYYSEPQDDRCIFMNLR